MLKIFCFIEKLDSRFYTIAIKLEERKIHALKLHISQNNSKYILINGDSKLLLNQVSDNYFVRFYILQQGPICFFSQRQFTMIWLNKIKCL